MVGQHLEKRLLELQQRYMMVGDVRGKGLFQGIELVRSVAALTVRARSLSLERSLRNSLLCVFL